MSNVITVATTLGSALGGVTFKVERNDVNTQLHSYTYKASKKTMVGIILLSCVYIISGKNNAPPTGYTHAYAHTLTPTDTENITPTRAISTPSWPGLSVFNEIKNSAVRVYAGRFVVIETTSTSCMQTNSTSYPG